MVGKKYYKKVSVVLMVGALASIVMSSVGYLGYDIWLASTQWLLVSAVLALFGVYAKLAA
jgi:hypothetical protein